MKYAFAACMALGIFPSLSSIALSQTVRAPRAMPPVPAEFATINSDEKVTPVAHFTSVSDAGGPKPRARLKRAVAAIPAPLPLAEPTTMVPTTPPRPLLEPQQGVTMQVSDSQDLGSFSGTMGDLVADGCADGGCADGGCMPRMPRMPRMPSCAGDCGGSCVSCCAPPVWQHRSGVYGEYLYLRPREAEIVYAAPIEGPIVNAPNNPIQIGALGMVDPEYSSGYRTGFAIALNDCSSITAGYTNFNSASNNSITTQPAEVLRSLVAHPSSTSAASDWLDASAQYDIDFQFADIAYRGLWRGGDRYAINYLVGARYGKLDQSFARFLPRMEWRKSTRTSILKGAAFALESTANGMDAGKSSSSIRVGTPVSLPVNSMPATFKVNLLIQKWPIPVGAGRIVTVLDLEAGCGWRSQGGKLKLSAGYLVSGWLNAVKANHFIRSVQENNFLSLSDTFTFDGFVVRGEYRF